MDLKREDASMSQTGDRRGSVENTRKSIPLWYTLLDILLILLASWTQQIILDLSTIGIILLNVLPAKQLHQCSRTRRSQTLLSSRVLYGIISCWGLTCPKPCLPQSPSPQISRDGNSSALGKHCRCYHKMAATGVGSVLLLEGDKVYFQFSKKGKDCSLLSHLKETC